MMKNFLKCISLALVIIFSGMTGAAAADRQTFLGQHGVWYAYKLIEDGQRSCYIVSKPRRSRGKFRKRGDVVVFVTHRPKEKERDVINFQAGYTFKLKSTVTVSIKDKKFSLITDKDAAWSKSVAADKVLIAAMKKGNAMKVVGKSKSGVTTTDTYSLKGFTRAIKKINRACGLK
ncbi:MAG: invasion associated locus B family protein [Alphaproteobacteria bacterium]